MPEWFDTNLVSVLNGLAIGCLLFLVASGLSLVFGMMDVLNLAHGAVFLVGAYVGYASPGTARAGRVRRGPRRGAARRRGLRRRPRGHDAPAGRRGHLDQALLTLGVALVLADLSSSSFGRRRARRLGADRPRRQRHDRRAGLSRLPAGADRRRARRSRSRSTSWSSARASASLVRAAVADREMLEAMGVDSRKVLFGVFAAGCALAGFAGVLGAQIYGARPGLEDTILLLALVVIVIGGLGSIRGALVGALVIGQVESLGRALLPDLAPFLLFGAMALVLLVPAARAVRIARGRDMTATEPQRPRGAAPPPRRRAGAGAPGVARRRSCSCWRPFALDPAPLNTLGRIVYFALLAASLDLLVGITGLPSLAHAGLLRGSAPTRPVWSPRTQRARGVGAARGGRRGRAAAATGWFAVRSGGIYFLMLTLAIGEIIFQLAERLRVTGGSNGLFGIPVCGSCRAATR